MKKSRIANTHAQLQLHFSADKIHDGILTQELHFSHVQVTSEDVLQGEQAIMLTTLQAAYHQLKMESVFID